MPIINGVYLKDFTALPGAVADANIIPIAITGDIIAYRTTVSAIVTDARVTSKLLTGLSVTGGAVVAADTILQAFGKVQNQINGKQGTITLTTTGTSGAATLVGSTLNIPNYADGGVLSLSAVGSTPNANAATITGTVLNLEPASASFGGVVTTLAQTFAGDKTLTGALIGTTGSFTSSGGSDTFSISHSSGAGIALNITKGGNGEGIYVNKTSGSGNAVTIIGTLNATTLVKSGGTSAQFLKADGTVDSTAYGTGSVTSVAALTLGTTGTDLSSTVANGTTTPVITLNVPTASATNRGALSAADWSTFNGKQNAITLTTTGSSGAATLIGATLNIPIYSTDLSGYVPYTGANQTLQMGTNNGITLTDTGTSVSIAITSSSTGQGALVIDKSVNGSGVVVNNSGIGYGIYANNTSTGSGIAIGNSSTGKGLFIDNAAAATGDPFAYSLNGVANIKAKIDYIGNITGQSFIPSGATVPTNGMYLSAANTLDFATNSNNRLSISSAGAATFTGALSGTTAAFSGAVGVGISTPFTLANYNFVNTDGVSGGGMYMSKAGVGKAVVYSANDDLFHESIGSSVFATGSILGGTPRLTIAATGESTFSKSVTINDAAKIKAGNGNQLIIDNSAERFTQIDWYNNNSGKSVIFWDNTNNYFQIQSTPASSKIRVVAQTNGVELANGGTSWSSLSDIREKTIIRPIQDALTTLKDYRTVIGRYNTDSTSVERAFLIAQDVQMTYPYAVTEDDDADQRLRLSYTELIPLLVKSIQELKAEIDILKGIDTNTTQ